ncbi:hypothetical protein [Leptospira interrogans]|uniref:DUF4376 domain-containing protein n=1 Tax=Leptospira interrogans TaxID=173 RepID=UPI0007747419|nr:hypothetical protein [Leptospira interrogans]
MSNYVIDKYSKKVIWINPDPNQLSGKSVWSDFNSETHEIVYAIHYNPQLGDLFKADIANGIATDFEPKKVYDTKTMAERVLQNWEDEIDPATETEDEPLKDSNGNFLTYQNYTDSGWVANDESIREALLATNRHIFNSQVESYHGRIQYRNTTWDSGRKYLENIQKTLSIYSKRKIQIPKWRDANNMFHSLNSEELLELSDLIELDLFNTGQALYSKKWATEEKITSIPQMKTLDLTKIWD